MSPVSSCPDCGRPIHLALGPGGPNGTLIRLEPDPHGIYRIGRVDSVFVADRLGDGRRRDHVKRGTQLYRLHLCDFRGDLAGVDWGTRYDLIDGEGRP